MEAVKEKKQVWRIIDLIEWGEDYFKQHKFDSPKQEIEWLLCDLLDHKRVDFYLSTYLKMHLIKPKKTRIIIKQTM